MPRLLALQNLEEGQDGTSVVICGCLTRTKEVQPVGRAFFDKFEAACRSSPTASPEPSDSGGDGSDDVESPGKSGKKKTQKERDSVLKFSDLLKGEDLYGLLELDCGSSQEDIKKAYRRLCLVHHPDKQSPDNTPEETEKVNQHFLKLQETFEVLSDVKKRRKYDSMEDFDDSVPTTLKKGQDFYVVFGPVFKRNGKWSERKPVPDLGDAETPIDRVNKFYDWWREFESWRDVDEQVKEEEGEDCLHKYEEAECREERRWMERENEKLRNKFRKIERARVMKLVGSAEQCDPRVKAEKDRKWAARDLEKAEKEAKRLEVERLAKEEADRVAAVEREEEEKRKVDKAKKDEEREAKKRVRASLRKMVTPLNLGIAEYQMQEFLLVLQQEETQSLTDDLRKSLDADIFLRAMRKHNFEPVFLKEDEQSTEEGTQEVLEEDEEEDTPEKRAEAARKEKERKKERERRASVQAAKEKEDAKLREVEAARRAEEKAIREAKRKVEDEKREADRKKQDKKDKEKAKKAEEKAKVDAEKKLEKAEQDKLRNQQLAEEQGEKARLENEKERLRKSEEAKQIGLERDRAARADTLEKMEWPAVIEAAQLARGENAGALAAAHAREGEDRIDAQLACLGSFFILGVRPSQDSPVLSATLRNRIKKMRTKLRTAVASDEFGELTTSTAVNKKQMAVNEKALQSLMEIVINGVIELPVEVETETKAEAAQETPGKKKKSKAKAADEEDLDALLAEFGVQTKPKKNKKK